MARTQIPVTEVDRRENAPPSPTGGDPTNGNYVANNGRVIIQLANSDTVDQTATVVLPGTVDGQEVADRSYTVPTAGELAPLGPWPVADYSDQLQIDVSSALVTVVAYHVPTG